MMERVSDLRSKVDRIKGRRDVVQSSLRTVESEIKLLEQEEDLLNLVSAMFRSLIDQEVADGVKAVETLQTEGLQAVFDDQDLSVRASIEESRGKVSVELITVHTKPDGTTVELSLIHISEPTRL